MPLNKSARDGSVLLETVLVLPIYMLLIGGTLWIGELTLAKQKLVMADRYAAWNVGNRHRKLGSAAEVFTEVQKRFFRDIAYERVQVRNDSISGVGRWWREAYAAVELKGEMPDWIRGWWAAARAMEGTVEPAGPYSLTGRNTPGMDHHAVMMRSDEDDGRGGVPSAIATAEARQKIFEAPWMLAE